MDSITLLSFIGALIILFVLFVASIALSNCNNKNYRSISIQRADKNTSKPPSRKG